MKKKININLLTLTVSIVLAITVAGTVSVNQNKVMAQDKPLKSVKTHVLTVSLIAPVEKEVKDRIKMSGNVVAWQESSISGELSGLKVEEIYVDVGSSVKKGQILAKLNNQTILADLEQIKANLEEAQANLVLAKQNAERARLLEGTNALSEIQKSQYITNEKIAKARVSSIQATMNSLNIKLSQTNVVAPANGTISERKATVGSIIGTGEMFKLIVEDKLQWQPNLAYEKALDLKRGTNVLLNIKNKEKIKAEISEISPKINMQNRQATILVNLDKEKHKGKVFPGMFVDGEVELGTKKALLVPKESVVLKDGINYVYKVNQNQVVSLKVDVGEVIGDLVVIENGLSKEDKIISFGVKFIKDGDIVRVLGS